VNAHAIFFSGLLGAASLAHAQGEHDHSHHHPPEASTPHTTSTHVPPDPPAHALEPMSMDRMHSLMGMDDTTRFASVNFDRVEWLESDDALAWDADARYGGDFDKLILKSEGELADDEHLRTELVWDHAMSAWWNLQAGLRADSGTGPTRTWAAFGIEGVAPYWIDLEGTVYLGESGRSAVRLEAQHDLRITQRLILQSQIEADAYGEADAERNLGSGLANIEAGLRLRFEVRREFAPYVGVQWTSSFGETADRIEALGDDADEFQVVVGLRMWL
jgi:copper resistance protein B